MRNGEVIDETWEALLDKLFLIYQKTPEAVGRNTKMTGTFDIFRWDDEPMNTDELQWVLQEFYDLCREPHSFQWKYFPSNATTYSRLFFEGPLSFSERLLLEEFIKHELPFLQEYKFPKFHPDSVVNFFRDISARVRGILIR